MSSTDETRQLFARYLDALNGKSKSEGNMAPFISDPHLMHHILMTEAAFPKYEITVDQLIAEGDSIAVRGSFQGTHTGDLPGLPASGKQISSPLMLFYRIVDGKISEYAMQPDAEAFMQKLSQPS